MHLVINAAKYKTFRSIKCGRATYRRMDCFATGFDSSKKYPLILEIHGGPHAAYGPHFAMEIQLMAAQGYVVVWSNPRGSSSYGEDFGNLIHHNYPSEDYNDLMDVVDAVVKQGYVDSENLFITAAQAAEHRMVHW